MSSASCAGVTSSPSPSWLVSKFWQKTQRRLHQKKIVPVPAAQAIFFARVRKGAGHPCIAPALARRGLVRLAIHLAMARAERARARELQGFLRLVPQSPFFERPEISRDKIAARQQEPTVAVKLNWNPSGHRLDIAHPSQPQSGAIILWQGQKAVTLNLGVRHFTLDSKHRGRQWSGYSHPPTFQLCRKPQTKLV